MFSHAIGIYPGARESEANWSAYWGFLKRYPVPVLREAFRRACLSSPEFFPSAVRVRECAEASAKTAKLGAGAVPTSHQLEGPREHVPLIGFGAEEWVNEAKNDGERLARTWQVESKQKGWDRGVEMPHEDGQRRFRELSKVLEKIGSSPAPTNGAHQTGNGSSLTGSGSSESQRSTTSSADEQSDGDEW
jgi:hypothetical protein